MSRSDINAELQAWLAAEDFSTNRDKITEIRMRYSALRDDEEKKAQEAFEQDEHEEGVEFSYKEDEHDVLFSELMNQYGEKRKLIEKQKRDEEQLSLREKKDLLEELQSLINDEENIAKAYKRFNAIKQKWGEIGKAPQSERRDLQAEYSRLIERFYYNINIYRELQINDLKKNLELKQELIEKLKQLEKESSINQVDALLHQYLEEWDQIGPTFQEEWDKIRDEYKSAISAAFDRIRDHRKTVRNEHQQNLDAKKALIERVKALLENEFADVRAIQNMTKEVIDIQKEWKHIGFAGRKQNDSIWKEFREACDAYFAKRNAFLEDSNKEFAKVREEKRGLVERAKEVHKGDDHDKIANELKGLQRQWKVAGRLLPQEEYKLFREFRKYCDAFFNRKKKEQEEAVQKMADNLKEREAFLKEIAEKTEDQIKEAGEAIIKDWKTGWMKLGQVHSKVAKQVEKQFEDTVTSAYSHLGISKKELAQKQFDNKLEMLSGSDDAENDLLRERDSVRSRMKEIELNKLQLENKLDFFRFSDDSNPLKKDVLDRIAKEQAQIDALRQKKKKIELMVKEMKKAAAKQADEANSGEAESEEAATE